MINKKSLFLIIIIYGFFKGLFAQADAVQISPTIAHPKDSIRIRLLTEKVIVPDSINQLFVKFSYSNFYELPQQMEMQKINNDWELKFQLPFYANYSSFFITDADQNFIIKPNDTTHFEIFVYEGNRLKEGNYLAKGYSIAYQNRKSKNIEPLQQSYFHKEQQDFPNNYENNLRILQYKMKMAKDASSKENFRQQALQVIEKKFRSNPTVDGNLNKVTMGFLIIGENQKLDSIRNVVINEFPNSKLGISYSLSKILDNPDSNVVINQIQQFLTKKTNENAESFQSAYSYLFEYYVRQKQTERALLYYPYILDKDTNPYTWRSYTEYVDLLLENGILLDKAQELNDQVLQHISDYPVTLVRYFPETGYLVSYDVARPEKIKKQEAAMLLRKGLILYKTGEDKRAKKLLLENFPKVEEKELLKNTAKVFGDEHDIKEEIAVWKHAYVLTPFDSLIRNSLTNSLKIQQKSQNEIEDYMQLLDDEWKNEYFKKLEKTVVKGKTFPSELEITDMEGNNLSTEDLKGKVVVVDLWATWCVPCLASFPYVHQVYLKYKDNPNVKFIILNTGSGNSFDDAKNWHKKNQQFTFPVFYNSDKKLNAKLEVTSIPTTFILDKNQNIIFKKVGSEGEKILQDLDAMIDFVLQK